MDTLPGAPEETPTYFYIGQHETKRTAPVTNLLVSQAQDVGVCHNFACKLCETNI